MTDTKRQIFREAALNSHIKGREKDVLPRLVSPPTFIFLWVTLLLLIVASAVAWSIQLPSYAAGQGMVIDARGANGNGIAINQESMALVFMPPTLLPKLHTGQIVHLFVGTGAVVRQVTRTVSLIGDGLISPEDARTQYHLNGSMAGLITGPAVVVKVRLGTDFVLSAYEGSIVTANIEVGSKRIISLIPGLDGGE